MREREGERGEREREGRGREKEREGRGREGERRRERGEGRRVNVVRDTQGINTQNSLFLHFCASFKFTAALSYPESGINSQPIDTTMSIINISQWTVFT